MVLRGDTLLFSQFSHEYLNGVDKQTETIALCFGHGRKSSGLGLRFDL